MDILKKSNENRIWGWRWGLYPGIRRMFGKEYLKMDEWLIFNSSIKVAKFVHYFHFRVVYAYLFIYDQRSIGIWIPSHES